MSSCVFCGNPIQPGEATAGRPPMAAHATCADAALADDRHWDAIAEKSPEGDGPHEGGGPPAAGRAGCLAIGLVSLGSMALLRRSLRA